MDALLLLTISLAVGVGARRLPGLPSDGWRVLNAWVVYVSLPALVLRAVHDADLTGGAIPAAATLWAGFAVAVGLAAIAQRAGWVDGRTAGAWALCAGLGNTAFVGLPVLEALGGPAVAPQAVVVDQVGSFGALSVLAVPYAAVMAGGAPSPAAVLRRLVGFPPFLALALALALRGTTLPAAFVAALTRLGSMLTPLALASIGWQLNLAGVRGRGGLVATGLLYKQVLMPALVLGLTRLVAGEPAPIAVMEAAMPPMVTAAVLATEHGLDPELASTMVATGLAAAIVSVPAWWLLLHV